MGGLDVYKRQDANFVGFEVQLGVIYYAAQKIFEGERDNAKVCLFDIAGIEEVVEPGEVDRFYINFCDPWPKAKHAKRRLTYCLLYTSKVKPMYPSLKNALPRMIGSRIV